MASITYYKPRRIAGTIQQPSRNRIKFIPTTFGNGGAVAVQNTAIYSVWRGFGLRYQHGLGGDGVSTPQITTRSDTP